MSSAIVTVDASMECTSWKNGSIVTSRCRLLSLAAWSSSSNTGAPLGINVYRYVLEYRVSRRLFPAMWFDPRGLASWTFLGGLECQALDPLFRPRSLNSSKQGRRAGDANQRVQPTRLYPFAFAAPRLELCINSTANPSGPDSRRQHSTSALSSFTCPNDTLKYFAFAFNIPPHPHKQCRHDDQGSHSAE